MGAAFVRHHQGRLGIHGQQFVEGELVNVAMLPDADR